MLRDRLGQSPWMPFLLLLLLQRRQLPRLLLLLLLSPPLPPPPPLLPTRLPVLFPLLQIRLSRLPTEPLPPLTEPPRTMVMLCFRPPLRFAEPPSLHDP